MADKRNFTALEWVSGEIGETLKQAAEALEAYASNKEDATRIRFCLNHIHQVRNILEMVELHGGALLAEEMEKLSRSLIEKTVLNTGDAVEVLMRAILQLPLYLDRVRSLRTDDPASLMALLNDLRAVRGEHLFTETQLFSPDMRAAREISGPRVRLTEDKFAEIIHKLRQGYESAMVKVLRDRNIDDSLPILKKVFENFKKICQGTARFALWDVCLATLEGIENDTIPGSIAINNLLRQVDKEIRHMAHGGSATLDEFTPEELIKNLLYYIARSSTESPLISALHELYKLDRALPGMGNADGSFGAAEPDAMRSVVVAVCEEFSKVKNIFDALSAGTTSASEGIPATVSIFKQTGDTLAVLGLGDLRRKLEQISNALQKNLDTGTAIAPDALMDAAATLLEVETTLNERYNRDASPTDDGSPRSMDHAISSAQESVLLECHNGLEQAKEAIVEYIGSQWDKSRITDIPNILQAVRGGLEIVGQRRAARILGACSRYIKEKLLDASEKPAFADMDNLADAMASIEYYLECLDDDIVEDNSETLALAESSVASLGYAVAAHQRASAAQFIDDEQLDIEPVVLSTATAEETEALVARLHEEPDAIDETAWASAAATLEQTPISTPASTDDVLTHDDTVDDIVVDDMTVDAVAVEEDIDLPSEPPTPVPVTTKPVAAVPTPVAAQDLPETCADDLVVDDFDDEIAEIFIEEAEEVMEAIREYYPQWRSNFADNASLTEFRRGFHTLKGSGRMAKALQLGELSWSVENMLNRIIDGTIEADDNVCTIIDRVIDKLPSMIEAFRQRKVDPQPALSQRLYNAATALAKGERIPSLDASVSTDTTVDVDVDAITLTETASIDDMAPDTAGQIQGIASDESLDFPTLQETAEITEDDMPSLAATPADAPAADVFSMDHLEDMDPDFDFTLWEIFASEAETHLEVADEWVSFARERSPLPVETSDPLQRALHTLKGSAHMAEVTPIAELATPFEKFVKELRAYQIKVGDDFTDLLAEMVAEIRLGIDMIMQQKRVVLPHSQSLLDRTSAMRLQLTGGGDVEATSKTDAPPPELATVDPSRFNEFLITGMDALMHVTPLLDAWETDGDGSGLDRIVWELEEMSAGAALAGLEPIAALAQAIAPCYAHARQTHSGFTAWRPIAEQAHDALIDFMDRMAASEDLVHNTSMEAQCADFLATAFEDAPVNAPPEMAAATTPPAEEEWEASAELLAMAFADEDFAAKPAEPLVEDTIPATTPMEDALDAELLLLADDGLMPTFTEADGIAAPETAATVTTAHVTTTAPAGGILEHSDDLEPELLDIFLEEANDLAEELESIISDWQASPEDSSFADALRRNLHTLKGGARMSGLTGLGSLAHDLETQLEQFSGMADSALFAEILQYQDCILAGIDQGRALAAGQTPTPLHIPLPGMATAPAAEPVTMEVIPELPVIEDVIDIPVMEDVAAEPEDIVVELEDVVVESEDFTVEPDSFGIEVEEITFPTGDATGATTAPAGGILEHSDDLEPELLDIFLEEANDLAEELESIISDWQASPEDSSFADALRRNLHTLKGGARMSGLTGLGSLAHDLETQLEQFSGMADSALFVEILQYQDCILAGIDQGRALAAGQTPTPLHIPLPGMAAAPAAEPVTLEAAPELPVIEDVIDIPVMEDVAAEPEDIVVELEDVAVESEDFAVESDSFGIEVEEITFPASDAADTFTPAQEPTMIRPAFFGDTHAPIIEDVLPESAFPEEEALPEAFLSEEAPLVETTPPVSQDSTAPAGGILEHSDDLEPELLDIFLEEANDLAEELESIISDWQASPEDSSFADALRRNLHTLKGGARMSGLTGLGSLAHELETQLEQFSGMADSALFAEILQYQDCILAGIGQGRALAAGQAPTPLHIPLPGMAAAPAAEPVALEAAPELPVIEDAIDIPVMEDIAVEATPEPEVITLDEEPTMIRPAVLAGDINIPIVNDAVVPAEAQELADTDIPVITDSLETETTSTAAETPAVDLGMTADIDAELLGIFIDEADELLEDLDNHIRGWQAEPSDRSFCDALKRTLHTYKGGARMAGIMGLGELAHDLETQLEQFSGAANSDLFATIHQYQDKLLTGTNWVRRIAAGETLDQILGVKPAAAEPAAPPVPTVTAQQPEVTPASRDATAVTPAVKATPDEAPPTAVILPFRGGVLPTGLAEAAEGKRYGQAASDSKAAQAQQEMIKVSADLLESLVNLAGETSINRSRVEQQMNDIRYSASDMDGTINRLQDLLRRLKTETDAQIQSRISEMQERSDDFDPLEMDRYSTLQQLTSSLSESASDLIDIRNSLNNKLRDTETLLIQQSRINTDLQEGLMRSRMVPFSRLEPRLRRIVRQVAGELKKEISFDLENVQGELDRTMLERMVAPLEHMLRNACDHGVETPDKRVAAGKPRQGRIILSLGREGGDILISLRDDGGGINVEAVKRKAIERGLMNPDAPLTDSEILQFILQAGFSTAEKVTQISGRGVGMDVVNSEIKQMGGNMTIHSAVGKGSEFIIRLPFTVSVNRALMVRAGEELYAVPLNSIEGIVRVSPFELDSYYDDPTAQFEYASRHYQVRYLGALLHTKQRPNMEGLTLPEPVLLLRGTDHTVALHVDQLVGSREIVVKSLGSQFASVAGLSGATLLGDGSVIPILDLPGLVRANFALAEAAIALIDDNAEPTIQETITVMVCDDSVTVRKVTSRLLEREGYEVMLAKDGADALLQMQDKMPDVLLLDIEMPRMDGFEVASSMKGSHRLQDIPIIMITSRTGEKHRERALAMGVERYMGKPFVEDELLMNINDLVGERLARRMERYERSGEM